MKGILLKKNVEWGDRKYLQRNGTDVSHVPSLLVHTTIFLGDTRILNGQRPASGAFSLFVN